MNKLSFFALVLLTAGTARADATKDRFTCTCLAPDGTFDTSDRPNFKTLGTIQLTAGNSDEAEFLARRTCISKFRNVDAFSLCDFAK